jgi:hypothetical protein
MSPKAAAAARAARVKPRLSEAEEAEAKELALLLAPRSVPTGLEARDDTTGHVSSGSTP